MRNRLVRLREHRQVYFAVMEHGSFLKIGVSSCPERRVRELAPKRCGMKLLGTIPCAGPTYKGEKLAHNLFREFWCHGEWYMWTKEVQEKVSQLHLNED